MKNSWNWLMQLVFTEIEFWNFPWIWFYGKMRKNKSNNYLVEVTFTEKFVNWVMLFANKLISRKIHENMLNNFFWSWFHVKFVKIKKFHSCSNFRQITNLDYVGAYDIFVLSVWLWFEFEPFINTPKLNVTSFFGYEMGDN